jgi:hypothetical protein
MRIPKDINGCNMNVKDSAEAMVYASYRGVLVIIGIQGIAASR